jgi:hypothetical protein
MLAQQWHRWFAWYPVVVDGSFVFCRYVERRGCEDKGGGWTEYRNLSTS